MAHNRPPWAAGPSSSQISWILWILTMTSEGAHLGSLQVPAPQQQAYEGCLHQDHQPHRNKYPKKIQKLAKCFILIFLSGNA